MRFAKISTVLIAMAGVLVLSACGDRNQTGPSANNAADPAPKSAAEAEERETIWDIFRANDSGTQVQVNKYLWKASMDVLNFLPLEAADPLTGTIIYGWGRAPGSATEFRAAINISNPSLEASALRVSIQSRSGAASAQTQYEIENAILTRARQLRIADVRG